MSYSIRSAATSSIKPCGASPGKGVTWSSASPAGASPALPANIALLKNASLIGLFWGAYLQRNPAVIRDSFTQLLQWYAAGKLKPHIHKTYPLEEAPAALRELLERRAMGKVLLTV